MKHLKMLAIAAVAAMAFMAISAGSASATVLCKEKSGETCVNQYLKGTAITATLTSGTEWVMTAGFATVACSGSTIAGKTTNNGGASETVVAVIETLNFTGCPCSVAVLAKGELEIHTDSAASDGNGTVTGKGSRWTMNCSGVSCVFGTAAAGTDLGTLHGGMKGKLARLTINAKIPYFTGDASNFVCTLGSATASLTADYTFSAPEDLTVT